MYNQKKLAVYEKKVDRFDYLVINFSLQIVGLQSSIYFHSVPLTNKIQTHSSTSIFHMDDIKMVRRCKKKLLITTPSFKNMKTFLTNYIQVKNDTYQYVQRSSSIPEYFPGLHTSIPWNFYSWFKFSEAHTFQKVRLIGLELRQRQGMIRNLYRLTNGTQILLNISNKSNDFNLKQQTLIH